MPEKRRLQLSLHNEVGWIINVSLPIDKDIRMPEMYEQE
jgi:hypothetical protein